MSQFDLLAGTPHATPVVNPLDEQFRLSRFQIFNWGTFSGVHDVPLPRKGYMFVGPSGSGKSTVLDANTQLLTPHKWRQFNQAAGGEKGSARSLVTYMRGNWGQKSGANGEQVQQYLREDTTWSALAQTYTTLTGKIVTLCQVFWIKGRSTQASDVSRAWLVGEREFSVMELQAFASANFDTKLLRALPGMSYYSDYNGYGERFRRLMSIESDGALRVLYMLQAAKDLGNLNEFMRNFMLDEPETLDIAKKVVVHCQSLREAHASVVDARRQIDVLAPAKEAYDLMAGERESLRQIGDMRKHLEAFREQQKNTLLLDAISRMADDIGSKQLDTEGLRREEASLYNQLTVLQGKRNGEARAQLAQAESELRHARNTLEEVENRQALLTQVSQTLDCTTPTAEYQFDRLRDAVKTYLADEATRTQENLRKRDDILSQVRDTRRELEVVQSEIVALASRRSNIPANLLSVRSRLCDALSLDESEIPFAGELVDVADEEKAWKGAAERVMRNFAEHLVVSDRHYDALSRYVNSNHMGGVVKYFRATQVRGSIPAPARGSLAEKLEFVEHDLTDWVEERAIQQFDHVCVDSAEALKAYRRALTREGLVKSDDVSYRKDDRSNINDQRQWILGGDNRAKVAQYQDRAEELDARARALEADRDRLAPSSANQAALRQCESLLELTWPKFDAVTAQDAVEAALEQLTLVRTSLPDEDALEHQIAEAEAAHREAQQAASRMEASAHTLEQQRDAYRARRDALSAELLEHELSEVVRAELIERCAAHAQVLALDNLDLVVGKIKDDLARDERTVDARASTQRNAMLNQFRDYIKEWPLRAANIDATEASAPEFFAMLAALTEDNLPKHEQHFYQSLKEQGTVELMILSSKLDEERNAIKGRLEAINQSLATREYNPGTHLVIETSDLQLPEVMAFRQTLREIFSGASAETTRESAEHRFNLLSDLVQKLESEDPAAKAWRAVCLDVRRHLNFKVRELDAAGTEVETYTDGGNKSGGQKQKLAATCLATALRYQLGGKTTGTPRFATVVMDEAFNNSDADFTAAAMDVFKAFGFHMVLATPGKAVSTLEPYIGGAGFVTIADRRRSTIQSVEYLEKEQRLALSATERGELAEEV